MQPFVVRRFPFPEQAARLANGMTIQRKSYCVIMINSKTTKEQQAATMRHELAHIALNHFFDTTRSEDELEAEANNYAAQMTEERFRDLMRHELKWKGRISSKKKGVQA